MKKIVNPVYLIVALLMAAACEKMEDTYSKYTDGGETIYPGKADSLEALSGNKRMGLRWLIMSDPKITRMVVYWNDQADSLVMPFKKGDGIDTVNALIPNLDEGLYTFEVYTYDEAGHRSIKTDVIGEVFGPTFKGSISNRLVNTLTWLDLPEQNGLPAFKGAEVTWYGLSEKAIFMDIIYKTAGGEELRLKENPVQQAGRQPQFRSFTRLPDCLPGSSIRYRTAFLPDSGAIDTFYTDYNTYPVIK